MVTPLYWYSMTTPLKHYLDYWSAWMRVPELNFKKRMQGKTLWVISTSSGDLEEAEPMFRSLELSADYMEMKWGGVLWGNGSKPNDILSDKVALEKAKHFFTKSS
jgi:multimeric flavodoxin WrbA